MLSGVYLVPSPEERMELLGVKRLAAWHPTSSTPHPTHRLSLKMQLITGWASIFFTWRNNGTLDSHRERCGETLRLPGAGLPSCGWVTCAA